MAMAMADALDDDAAPDTTAAFTLHLDKPLLLQVENAAWNLDKDLFATVTRDHQIIVHRFNWQRLWAISPETKVTSLCWRPDGKALTVGHVDGSIAIHDVEVSGFPEWGCIATANNARCAGRVPILAQELQESGHDVFCYEDRTSRFFSAPPHIPPMPGTVSSFDMSGVLGHAAEDQSHANRKNVLRANIKDLAMSGMHVTEPAYRLLDASALQVSLSKDLHNMIVICSGVQSVESLQIMAGAESRASGLYAISVDTSLLGDRRKELRQVALQASSVEATVMLL